MFSFARPQGHGFYCSTLNLPEHDKAGGKEIVVAPDATLAEARRSVVGRVHWKETFAAFRHRNYKLFFAGQSISLIGSWMQTVAEGWLVYQISNSAFLLGAIRFLHTCPVTFFSFLGGAAADRLDKRKILLTTQWFSLVLALVLFGLVYSGRIQIWHMAVLGLGLGLAHAFDVPSRQSLVIDMVGKKDLMNAIALNSSMFNGARIIGPALAGLLIAKIGVAGCFFLNGLSFLAVIASYTWMRLPTSAKPAQQPLGQATLEGFRYVTGQPVLRAVLGLVALISFFGWSYSALMPAIARDILGVGAKGYGYLMAANGLGAFAGALTLASIGNSIPRERLLAAGVLGFSVMILGFSASTNPWLSGLALVAAGWFMIVFFATANTMVQLRVPDELRGRVMGIYSFCFLGVSPFGSLLAGTVAKWTNPPMAIGLGAVVCLLFGSATILYLRRRSKEAALA